MTHYIQKNSGLSSKRENPLITSYEDNAAYIAILKREYIKGDRMKHIAPKFFFTHDLQKKRMVKSICNRSNLAII